MEAEARGNGGLGALVTIAYRNIWRNSRRTALCVAAVAIAVFFNIFMQAWVDGMMDSIEEVVQTFETGHVHVVSSDFEEEKEYFPVQYPVAGGRSAEELAAEIGALPGVRAVLPRITAYATLFDSTKKHALLWGVRAGREREANYLNLTDRGDGLVEGHYPEDGSNECAIGRGFSRETGLRIGNLPLKTVSSQFSDKYWSPTIVGIFEFDYAKYDEEVAIVSFDRLRRILTLGEGTQQLFVYAQRADEASALKAEVERVVGVGQAVREWGDNYWIAMMRQMSFLYVIIFAIFQVVAAFLIVNTVLMVIHERIKEIGMMGAQG